MKEFKDLQKEPSDMFVAYPLEDNLFQWHFTIRGPDETEFENGLYHGRFVLPNDYPHKPPDVRVYR